MLIFTQVLAFEEVSSSKIPSPYGHTKDRSIASITHGRSQSQQLSSQRVPPSRAHQQGNRARAPSDPFIDATPSPVSRSAPSSYPSANPSVFLNSTPSDNDDFTSPFVGNNEDVAARYGGTDNEDEPEDYMRVWTSPDLTNPEILELLKLFPSFVSRRPLPRFPAQSAKQPDIEEGEDDLEGKQIQFGTGSMWVSSKQRSDGWEGNWWARFMLWWKRLLCC